MSIKDFDTTTMTVAAAAPAEGPALGRRLWGLARAMRPWQWVKNLACLAGLVFSGRLFEGLAILEASLAFVGFCLASSGIYLINDVCDRRTDRANPRTRDRPIASGLVPVGWAVSGAVLLWVAAAASALPLGPTCWLVLAAYIGLSLAYSLDLKHRVLLDVLVIALGFVLRVLYGVYAVEVLPTTWIILCMFFLALFLGFAKRRGEMWQRGGEDHPDLRPVLRKYHVGFLDLLLGMMATMAILCYAMYTVVGRPDDATLVVTVPLVVYGIIRYMLLVVVHGAGEEPDRLLATDRVTLAVVAIWAALCCVIIYGEVGIALQS